MFTRRKPFSIVAAFCLMFVLVTGCTQEQQGTTIGGVLGAGLGAVIGHQSGHALEGAAIGALIGGLAGYIVGHSRAERVASADETAKAQGYRAVEGLQAELTQANVSPTIARPGDEIELASTLALNAPSVDQDINVRQRFALYKGDELVGKIVEDQLTLQPGTHRLIRSVTLQKDFPKGTYKYVSHVRAQYGTEISEDTIEKTFSVG